MKYFCPWCGVENETAEPSLPAIFNCPICRQEIFREQIDKNAPSISSKYSVGVDMKQPNKIIHGVLRVGCILGMFGFGITFLDGVQSAGILPTETNIKVVPTNDKLLPVITSGIGIVLCSMLWVLMDFYIIYSEGHNKNKDSKKSVQ